MLKKRSRAVASKQGLIPDNAPLPSPTDKYNRSTATFFSSPRLFIGFSTKTLSDSESIMSPTSILDAKPFSTLQNPLWSERNTTKSNETCFENRHPYGSMDSRGLVDALNDEKSDKKFSQPNSRMVLFGSQLKIQIPSLTSSADFGTKTHKSQMVFLSPSSSDHNSRPETVNSPRVFMGCLSASEMELSEDYTCVISHGPNPKKTHIFENFIVETVGIEEDRSDYPMDNFLRFCYACKKDLGQGKDIYMYRGEKAFCSRECRHQEMLCDEGMEKCASESSCACHTDEISNAVKTCP